MMQWQKEFGEEFAVPAEIVSLYTSGVVNDASWHNDVCPRFTTPDNTLEIWSDHPQADYRELPLGRFRVYRALGDDLDSYPQNLATLYEGYDINAAIAVFMERLS